VDGGLGEQSWGCETNQEMPIHNPPDETVHEEARFTTTICESKLERVLRDGAPRLLMSAVEAEVENYIERHKDVRDADGRWPLASPTHALRMN
jgi:hypothetical protein